MICSGCVIPEIWFIERPNDFAVVGFTTSTCAKYIQQIGEEKAKFEMASQLNRMFGSNKGHNYIHSVYYDWSKDPFIGGGYVCVLSEDQRDALFSFDCTSLFFAGESFAKSFSSVGGKFIFNFNKFLLIY